MADPVWLGNDTANGDDKMITEVAFTGTPVTDMKRARAFYEGVLGLKATMESAGDLWVEYDVGAGTLGLGCYGEAWKPSPDGICIAFKVDDLGAEFARLKSKGVPVHMDVMDTPVCRFAIVSDPDGNKLMLHKRKAR
jgi:predicted enzyme related to lactoylglutathione lyase